MADEFFDGDEIRESLYPFFDPVVFMTVGAQPAFNRLELAGLID